MLAEKGQHHMTCVWLYSEVPLFLAKHETYQNAITNHNVLHASYSPCILKVSLLHFIITTFMTRGICMCHGANVEAMLQFWTVILSFHCGIQESNMGH